MEENESPDVDKLRNWLELFLINNLYQSAKKRRQIYVTLLFLTSLHWSQASCLPFRKLLEKHTQLPSLHILSLAPLSETFWMTLFRNWQFNWQSSGSEESVSSPTSRFVNVLRVWSSSALCQAKSSASATLSLSICGLLCEVEVTIRKTVMALKTAPCKKPV